MVDGITTSLGTALVGKMEPAATADELPRCSAAETSGATPADILSDPGEDLEAATTEGPVVVKANGVAGGVATAAEVGWLEASAMLAVLVEYGTALSKGNTVLVGAASDGVGAGLGPADDVADDTRVFAVVDEA